MSNNTVMSRLNLCINPNAENIVDRICNYIVDFEVNQKGRQENDILDNLKKHDFKDYKRGGLTFTEEFLKLVNSNINQLYDKAELEDLYFYDCSVSTYSRTYSIRLNEFLSDYKDSDEKDFIEFELERFQTPEVYRKLEFKHKEVSYFKYLINDIKYEIALKRKLEFLNKKLQDVLLINGYNKSIFRNENAENWFFKVIYELNVFNENKEIMTGGKAKLSAIFYNKLCQEHIFKYGLLTSKFIEYLSDNFDAKIKNRYKLSDGRNHDIEVSNLIKRYIEQTLLNKVEQN